MNARNLKKDFDYNLVKVLDAVISAGNVTKASKRLSVTPAAVSIALTRLQLFYNEELFVRGKNGLIPTVKALEVHQSFRQVIDLVRMALTSERKHQEENRITILGGDITETIIFHSFTMKKYSIAICSGIFLTETEIARR